MNSKAKQFKNLLESRQLEFVMEAHSALCAKIVEATGFRAIWGSGLSLSASLGLRDNNEISVTQVLEVLEFMSDATTIPILLDADTGYGNFNNVRLLVKKLEQRNIAAMCIEDKLFPKTNSLIEGGSQPLADIDEFCGKIKAAKDTQRDDDFCVVARIEAFIAGKGLGEALKRAEAYHRAGADAVLPHSRQPDSGEVLSFIDEWKGTSPVVVIPTMYYKTPTSVFEEAGVNMAIWANHLLRASIQSIQQTAERIYADRSVQGIQKDIVPVSEVFRLQNAGEYQEAERKYLPGRTDGNEE